MTADSRPIKFQEPSPLAGKTVVIKSGSLKGSQYLVEDWWISLTGKSWMVSDGNPACLQYAMRGAVDDLPNDNNVLYGKVGALGHLVHESEL